MIKRQVFSLVMVNQINKVCDECGGMDYVLNMVLCRDCEEYIHPSCLQPPLPPSYIKWSRAKPWYCPSCVVGYGTYYSFELTKEDVSLADFYLRCKKFSDEYFKPWYLDSDNQSTTAIITEGLVEREYWRLLLEAKRVPSKTLVQYGADIPAGVYKSGFPVGDSKYSSETQKFEVKTDSVDADFKMYASNLWNLTRLPWLAIRQEYHSLLYQLKDEHIPGIIEPWLYIGMTFSTFCWHIEDHSTYSINYLHLGETKTWYGVPGTDAKKLERVMHNAAPDWTTGQYSWKHQIVSMLSPTLLQQNGVRVSRINQRAGEFVVTFPNAYHAGFNHGVRFFSKYITRGLV